MEFYDPKNETIFEDEGELDVLSDLVAISSKAMDGDDTRALYLDSIRADLKQFGANDDIEIEISDIAPEKVFDIFRTKNIPLQSSKNNFDTILTTGSKMDIFFTKLSLIQSEVSNIKEELDYTRNLSHTDSLMSPWSDLHNTAKYKLRQQDKVDVLSFQRKKDIIRRIKTLQNNLLVSNFDDMDKNSLKSSLHGSSSLVELLSKIESHSLLLDDVALCVIKDKIELYKSASDHLKLAVDSGVNQLYSENLAFLDHISSKGCTFESMSQSFPELVCRLKSLEIPHRNASNIVNNFIRVEQDLTKLSTDLKSNKELLIAIKDGIDQNKVIVNQNVVRIRNKLQTLNSGK